MMTPDVTCPPLRMAVLISGTGRSLLNMLQKIEAGQLSAQVCLVVASTPTARGLQYAEKGCLPIQIVDRRQYATQDAFSEVIFDGVRKAEADLVVLAGFLKQLTVPEDFTNRVVNIHPSLVPSFCGKGYYGHFVHEAALDYGVKISGCTVHYVDNQYDHGPVILQKAVPVMDDDTADALAARVFEAECVAYPEALQLIAEGRVSLRGRRVEIAPLV